MSDLELGERFRSTALYTVAQAASQNGGFRVLAPADALVLPTSAELDARWPGTAPEQIEALEADHRAESEQLAALKLEDVVDRVRELAMQDPMWM